VSLAENENATVTHPCWAIMGDIGDWTIWTEHACPFRVWKPSGLGERLARLVGLLCAGEDTGSDRGSPKIPEAAPLFLIITGVVIFKR
jgi:hypothetical protein